MSDGGLDYLDLLCTSSVLTLLSSLPSFLWE